MKTFQKSRLAAALLGVVVSGQVFALEYDVQMISNQEPIDLYAFDLNSQGKMVWASRGESWESPVPVMVWDGTQATQIATTSFNYSLPGTKMVSINEGGDVAWGDGMVPEEAAPQRILKWDGVSTIEMSASSDAKHSITGLNDLGQIAWLEGGYQNDKLLLSDGDSIETISSDLWDFGGPHIALNNSGDVVFSRVSFMDGEELTESMLMWNGEGIIELAQTSGWDEYFSYAPQLNEQGQVLWSVGNGYSGGASIYLWDGVQANHIYTAVNSFGVHCLDLNDNGEAVWVRYAMDGHYIEYWDGQTVSIIGEGFCPSINNEGQIAWSKWEDGGESIYVTDGSEIVKLASGLNSAVLNLSESGDIAWSSWDGIYLAALVKPLTPQEAIQALIDAVTQLNSREGIINSLDAKLNAAVSALNDINQNNNVSAVAALEAFVESVQAQSGVQIDAASGEFLIVSAQEVIAMLSEG